MSSKATGRKLLLVEDDRATYAALKGILSLRGWDVTVATSLAEATRAIEGSGAAELDAVILDLMLPDGDGEALLQRLRQHAADAAVVVVTGVNDADRIAAVERMAPTVVLRKPITLADLLRAITPAA